MGPYITSPLVLLAARPLKAAAAVAASVASEESTDWLEALWSFVAGLVAPEEEEEEGIHLLTDPFTCKSILSPLNTKTHTKPNAKPLRSWPKQSFTWNLLSHL